MASVATTFRPLPFFFTYAVDALKTVDWPRSEMKFMTAEKVYGHNLTSEIYTKRPSLTLKQLLSKATHQTYGNAPFTDSNVEFLSRQAIV